MLIFQDTVLIWIHLMKKAIDEYRVWDWWEEENNDTMKYFQNRIEYEYKHQVWNETEQKEIEQKDTAYYLTNKKSIPLKDIKTIKIDKIIEYSPFIEISNELQLSDSTWMRQESIEIVLYTSAWGFVCSNQIFVHARSEKVYSVIRQLELKYKELYEVMTDEDIYENVSKISEEIQGILKQLNGEKVVVISECTD